MKIDDYLRNEDLSEGIETVTIVIHDDVVECPCSCKLIKNKNPFM
jgi:hypothetical protein